MSFHLCKRCDGDGECCPCCSRFAIDHPKLYGGALVEGEGKRAPICPDCGGWGFLTMARFRLLDPKAHPYELDAPLDDTELERMQARGRRGSTENPQCNGWCEASLEKWDRGCPEHFSHRDRAAMEEVAEQSKALTFAGCPNLSRNVNPCECKLPRCPDCGYTVHDAAFMADHHVCGGTIPPLVSS